MNFIYISVKWGKKNMFWKMSKIEKKCLENIESGGQNVLFLTFKHTIDKFSNIPKKILSRSKIPLIFLLFNFQYKCGISNQKLKINQF